MCNAVYAVQSVTLNTGGRDLSGVGRPQHISNTENTHTHTCTNTCNSKGTRYQVKCDENNERKL